MEKQIGLQSDHYGIEMPLVQGYDATVNELQSDHYGIEIEQGKA